MYDVGTCTLWGGGGMISDIWLGGGDLISDIWFFSHISDFLLTRDSIDKIVIAMFHSGIGTSNCVDFDHDKTMSTVADMMDIATYGVCRVDTCQWNLDIDYHSDTHFVACQNSKYVNKKEHVHVCTLINCFHQCLLCFTTIGSATRINLLTR